MKKFTIIFLVAILVLTCAFVCGCDIEQLAAIVNGADAEPSIIQRSVLEPSTTPAMTVDELYMPDGLMENDSGLFFYDYGGKMKKSTDKDVYYDPDKPLVIYFHGNAYDTGYNSQESYGMGYLKGEANQLASYWLDKGYNVAVFYWSQFADEAVLNDYCCGYKIWSTKNAPKMRWAYEDKNGKKAYEEEDMPNCCLAEMFGAYYIDILDRLGFNGSEIRFTGHSMGAQFAVAASSYVTTKALGGVINSRYIPDRVTLYDGYYEGLQSDNYYCDWLDRKIGANGTLGICYDIIKDLRTLGVAIEHITTTGQTKASAMLFGNSDIVDKLYAETYCINYNSEGFLTDLGAKHQVSKNWFIYMNSLPIPVDNSDPLGKAYGVSPNVPTAYVYARMGTSYSMEKNSTFIGEDDVQYSTNIENAVVGGFAFYDANGNGINDDGVFNRLQGVKATLVVDGVGVATTTTAVSGYYSFNIAEEYVGKEVSVKFDLVDGYKATKAISAGSTDKLYMANSNIGEDGASLDSIKIDNKYTVAIFNVGLVK